MQFLNLFTTEKEITNFNPHRREKAEKIANLLIKIKKTVKHEVSFLHVNKKPNARKQIFA